MFHLNSIKFSQYKYIFCVFDFNFYYFKNNK